VPIATISPAAGVVEAAKLLIDGDNDLVAVVDEHDKLVGVLTDRDITRSVATDECADNRVGSIMTREVVSVSPGASIVDCVRLLEHHRISATPVVADGKALGLVSGDLLAKRTLIRLLQSRQTESEELSLAAAPTWPRRATRPPDRV
jgi:glutamate dehydrogenase (NAD(P)+)